MAQKLAKNPIIVVSAIVISIIALAAFGYIILDDDTTSSDIDPSTITGNVTIYTSVPTSIVESIKLEFQEYAPNITLEIYRAGTGTIMERIYDDINQTGKVGADVIWLADFSNAEELKEANLLQQYRSSEADKIIPILVDQDGYYTGSRLLLMVVAYNPQVVTPAPSSYDDLANSSWKGLIGMVNPQTSGSAFYMLSTLAMDPDFGWDFVEDLSDNDCKIVKNNPTLVNNISKMDLNLGITIDYTVRNELKDDPTLSVAYAYPENGSIAVVSPIALSRDCKPENLETSKLFIDWVLSKKGDIKIIHRLGPF
ncbi:MAG: extracellular solute-binding protein [Candidatus Hodarchaeales archaeon]|jgi:iron(III) transport system substrate-binding protein